jgi:GNAT superfamily N-acetyltransferase
MSASAILVRKARPADADAVARIYVESWQDTYPSLLPARLLVNMSIEGQALRWRNSIAMSARESIYVAEQEHRVVAMASMGPARDSALGFDAEIYTLYVDPFRTGSGIGRTLLRGAFAALSASGHERCVIWAHAKNPARYFYEAMGGRLVAERTTTMMGTPVPEAAFGWRSLMLAETSRT